MTSSVDCGDIRGGFDRGYDAAFVEDIQNSTQRGFVMTRYRWFTQTLWVSVTPPDGKTWTRAFVGTYSEPSPCLFTTPNPTILGVRAFNLTFAVDVLDPESPVELDLSPLVCAASDLEKGILFLASEIEVMAFDGVRVLWTTRHLSLDGITELSFEAGRVRGIATDVGRDRVPFIIDAATGYAECGFGSADISE